MSVDLDKLPKAIDIERQLLGSLLLKDGQIIPSISNILSPDDFYLSIHQIIYQIILDLHRQGSVPNLLSIIEELKKHRDFHDNQRVFLDAALSLGEISFTTAYAIDHAHILKEKSILRSLIRAGNIIIKNSYDPSASSEKIIHST